ASPAWDSIVAAILLQRDAGGDLPALLRELAGALEAAARQDRDAVAATAQARFTARIVLVLPIGAALLAELGSPGFLAGLLANPISAFLTCLALALQVLGLALLGGLAVLPLVPAAPGRLGLLMLLAAPAAGFLAPEVGLRRRTTARRRAMEVELPDVLDLLRVAVGAGLAPRRALMEIGRR